MLLTIFWIIVIIAIIYNFEKIFGWILSYMIWGILLCILGLGVGVLFGTWHIFNCHICLFGFILGVILQGIFELKNRYW